MHAVDRQRKKRLVHQHHPWTFGKHGQFLCQERNEETGYDEPSRCRCPGRAFGTHSAMIALVLCPVQAIYRQSNTPDWVYREIEMEALF